MEKTFWETRMGKYNEADLMAERLRLSTGGFVLLKRKPVDSNASTLSQQSFHFSFFFVCELAWGRSYHTLTSLFMVDTSAEVTLCLNHQVWIEKVRGKYEATSETSQKMKPGAPSGSLTRGGRGPVSWAILSFPPRYIGRKLSWK